ncbi:MAG: DMT family transporter [Bacteroidales bacterium]|nr:DMT family transporter [Bacteroidales bacterium]
MQKQSKSYLYALLAVAGWSTVATAFKISLAYLDIFQLVFYASLVSLIIYFIVIKFQSTSLNDLKPKDFLYSSLLGFLNPFAYYLILLKAYDLLLAQEAGTLNYIWPIVLVLLSIPILKQKISLFSFLAILISFCGVITIGSRGNFHTFQFNNEFGVLLTLLSAIIWSLYWILNLKDKRADLPKLFLNFVFGTIYAGIALLLFSSPKIENLNGIFGVIYIGIFELGITYIFWMKALNYAKTTASISNLIFLSPFISLIIIHKILKEPIYWSTIVGLGFIISGIILQRFLSNKKFPSN